MFMASSVTPINADDELFLRYGSHSNPTLFVEYGFVNYWTEGECQEGKYNGEVDVQDILEELFSAKGSTGDAMKEVLEEEGYWGYCHLFMYILRRPANTFACRGLQRLDDAFATDTCTSVLPPDVCAPLVSCHV